VPVSTSGEVHGHRQHGRGTEFPVRGTLSAAGEFRLVDQRPPLATLRREAEVVQELRDSGPAERDPEFLSDQVGDLFVRPPDAAAFEAAPEQPVERVELTTIEARLAARANEAQTARATLVEHLRPTADRLPAHTAPEGDLDLRQPSPEQPRG